MVGRFALRVFVSLIVAPIRFGGIVEQTPIDAAERLGVVAERNVEFFAWVNGVDVPGTWSTLDEALIGCINFRKQKK